MDLKLSRYERKVLAGGTWFALLGFIVAAETGFSRWIFVIPIILVMVWIGAIFVKVPHLSEEEQFDLLSAMVVLCGFGTGTAVWYQFFL